MGRWREPKDPDCQTRFGEWRIVYYCKQGMLSAKVPPDFLARVDTRDDIPHIYEAGQCLIRPDGRVEAVTWNEKVRWIRTTKGDYPGTSVAQLPEEFFAPYLGDQGTDN